MNPLVISLMLTGASATSSGINQAANSTRNLGNNANNASTQIQKVGGSGKSMGDAVRSGADRAKAGLATVVEWGGRVKTALTGAGGAGQGMGSSIVTGTSSASAGLDKLMTKANQTGRTLQAANMRVRAQLGGPGGTFQERMDRGDANQQALADAGGQVRNAGLAIGAVGAGGMALLGKSIGAAGEMEGYRTAFKRQFGEEGGERQLADSAQFAKESSFSLQGTIRNEQLLSASGFGQDELLPTMKALGNAVAATGQGQEVLDRVAVNLGQIRNMDHPAEVDLKQFAYAGINIEKVMSAAMGKAMSKADIKKMSGAEFVSNFVKGANIEYKDADKGRVDTLPGQVSRLNDSLFQLGAIIGTQLLPPVKFLVSMASGVVDFFAGLPAPIQAIIAYGGALIAGILVLGGGFLALAGMAASSMVSILTLSGSLGTLSASAGIATFSTAGLAAGLRTAAVAMGLVAIAAWGFQKAAEGNEDGQKMSDSELKEKHGALGAWWAWAGGQWDTSEQVTDDDRKGYEMYQKKARKHGWKEKSFEEWKGHPTADSETVDDVRNRKEAEQRAKMVADQKQMMADMGMSAGPVAANGAVAGVGAMQPQMGVAPGMVSGVVPMAAPGAVGDSQIEALQDQIAQSADKDQKKALREQLRLAQRARRHSRQSEAEARRQERAIAKKEREEERAAAKATRLSDRKAGIEADLEEAELSATTKVQIAEMKRAGASKAAIARVKADAEIRKAQIRAKGEGSDSLGAAKAIRLGAIRAKAAEAMGDYEDENGSAKNRERLNGLVGYMRRGGNLYNLNKKGNRAAAGAGGSGGGYDDNRNYVFEHQGGYDSTRHQWAFTVKPIVIKDPYGRDAAML